MPRGAYGDEDRSDGGSAVSEIYQGDLFASQLAESLEQVAA